MTDAGAGTADNTERHRPAPFTGRHLDVTELFSFPNVLFNSVIRLDIVAMR